MAPAGCPRDVLTVQKSIQVFEIHLTARLRAPTPIDRSGHLPHITPGGVPVAMSPGTRVMKRLMYLMISAQSKIMIGVLPTCMRCR